MLTDAKRASGYSERPFCLLLSGRLEGELHTEPASEAVAEVVLFAEAGILRASGLEDVRRTGMPDAAVPFRGIANRSH